MCLRAQGKQSDSFDGSCGGRAVEGEARRWAHACTRWPLRARLLTLVSLWGQKALSWVSEQGKCHTQSNQAD